MGRKAIVLVVFFFSFCTYSQNKRSEIENDMLSFSTNLDTNSAKAFFYIDRAYRNSIAIDNDSLVARSACNYGHYYYTQNRLWEAKKKTFEAVRYAKKTRYLKILASSYNQLGLISLDEDKFDESLKYYLAALKITDTDELPIIRSRILINLGYLHALQKDTIKAINTYNENIENALSNRLSKELSIGYEAMAILYSRSDKEKADSLYQNALRIALKNKDLYAQFRLYIDLSDLYLGDKNFEHSTKVYRFLDEAVKVQRLLKEESLLFYVYFNYGSYYLNNKQCDLSLDYYYRSLSLTKNNILSEQVIRLYQAISQAYICKGDYRHALLFKENFLRLKDSIFNIKKDKAFKEIQTKYDVDKKNLQIKLLTKEHEIQENKKHYIVFVALVVLLLLIAIVMVLYYRIKVQKIRRISENKIHQKLVETLEQEQEIKRMRGVLEGQDQERNRLSKEIHDGIGGFLAGIKLQLSQVNDVLQDTQIKSIEQQMEVAFNELRSVSHHLSVNHLQDKSLAQLLFNLKSEYENRKEFTMDIVIFPDKILDNYVDDIKRHIYRIVQELLANASKHAYANHITLSFTRHKDILNIIFEDDGIGFKNAGTEGIGIKNIRERIAALTGTVIFESGSEKGTTIIINIPTQKK